MVRLFRPHIPLSVRSIIATRQFYENGKNAPAREDGETLPDFLARQLTGLASLFGCDVSDLRLDHDPALAARIRRGSGRATIYEPPANSPNHLSYRPHGPEFAGSHLIKTNCRGDHGQHPDRVLIKKMRRIERGPRPKRQPGFKTNPEAPKRRWPSRPFPSKGRKR